MELDKETEEMMFRTIAFLQGGRFRSLTDMNQGELALLRIVMDHGNDISPGELTEKLEVSTARTANLLNSLEKKGLIVRDSNEKDHRSKCVYLTDKAKQMEEHIREIQKKWSDYIMQDMTVSEAELFAKQLKQMSVRAREINE